MVTKWYIEFLPTRMQVLRFDGGEDVFFLERNDDDDDKGGGSSEVHNYHQTKSD